MVAVVLITSAAVFLVHLRSVLIEGASRRVEDTARLLQEHVGRTLGTTDFVVGRVVELARQHSPDELANSANVHRQIRALTAGLPERGSLWLFGPDGQLLASSTDYPLKQRTTAIDHIWYKAIRDGADRVVGPLMIGRYDVRLVFTYNRRITDADGRFVGTATAGLDATYFTDFYRSFGLGLNGNTVVADLEGRVMLRQPDPGRWLEATIASGPLMRAQRERPQGLLRAASPLDAIERLVGYRTLPEYGLVVASGIALPDVLEDWRTTAFGIAVLVATALAALAGLTLLALRGLTREQAILQGLEEVVQQRTEEAREQAEQARLADESKTRFLAAASHDLRQPLQAAGMFTEALAVRLDDPGHLAVVDKLRQSIEATNALLTTLLDVSALEAARLQPSVTTFAIWPLLSGLAGQYEPEATARGLEIRVVPNRARIVSDPVLLERLLRNLLVNALRYTDGGRVLLGCRRHGDRLAVVVADSGIGIPADKLDDIFEDFIRIDTPGRNSKEAKGLGLGLGVVRRMGALLGHPLTVRSRPGTGSEFSVIVPVAEAMERRREPSFETGAVAPSSG
ncbi:MAG: sensor histidine kinase [Magnetospirillum sp.]|nr:sensor histidine kinase [Magnetospirillum sp.]